MSASKIMEKHQEIAELLRSRPLSYPIATRAAFVEQMAAGSDTVVFRGKSYDTRFGAGLLPEFFFPLTSEEDLVIKVTELLISRGLVPLE